MQTSKTVLRVQEEQNKSAEVCEAEQTVKDLAHIGLGSVW